MVAKQYSNAGYFFFNQFIVFFNVACDANTSGHFCKPSLATAKFKSWAKPEKCTTPSIRRANRMLAPLSEIKTIFINYRVHLLYLFRMTQRKVTG
ncbi:hypothetical protein OUZ56_003646 [Daphnia magna]|uniref:Secreted protein n=1 Tax=Daphnia magna TaxID=35525 RepID=A0ABR0A9B8_9CRUS|nr:hypothetical protein OUZ56_003646 [Daphnia magna]